MSLYLWDLHYYMIDCLSVNYVGEEVDYKFVNDHTYAKELVLFPHGHKSKEYSF